VLAGKVDDLREIGERRDDDAGNADELKHEPRPTPALLERRLV
jgi:hypothetical protein